MAFNDLRIGEAERLALLLEELGEAQQAVGKILRHGYNCWHPDHDNGPDNRARLEHELGDVLFAIDLLIASDDINYGALQLRKAEKGKTVPEYLHHQRSVLKSMRQAKP